MTSSSGSVTFSCDLLQVRSREGCSPESILSLDTLGGASMTRKAPVRPLSASALSSVSLRLDLFLFFPFRRFGLRETSRSVADASPAILAAFSFPFSSRSFLTLLFFLPSGELSSEPATIRRPVSKPKSGSTDKL